MSLSPRSSTVESSPVPERAHRIDVDVMRIAAGLTVMLGHSGGVLIHRGEAENTGFAWLLGHLAEAVNPWAVPLYFMIAGWATLLGAPPRTSTKIRQRVTRFVVPLLAWSVIFAVGFNLLDTDAIDLRHLLVRMFFESGHPAFHLWYLYAYIPLILVFGTLMLFLAGKRPWISALCCAALAGSSVWVPFLLEHLGKDTEVWHWSWSFAMYQVIYFALGGFLIHHAKEIRPPVWVLVTVFVLGAAGVFWWETDVHYPIANANPLILVVAIPVILGISRIEWGPRARKIFGTLATAAFGAFLVHVFFLEIFFQRFFVLDVSPVLVTIQFVGYLGLTAVLSYALSFAWGRIGLRSLLG